MVFIVIHVTSTPRVLLIQAIFLLLIIASTTSAEIAQPSLAVVLGHLPSHVLTNHAELSIVHLVFIRVLLDKLLEQGDLLGGVRVQRVARHHMRGQDKHHLAVSHLFVVEGVHLGE